VHWKADPPLRPLPLVLGEGSGYPALCQSAISKELEEIAVKLERLVTFNKLVYSPFYQKILQDILKQKEGLDV